VRRRFGARIDGTVTRSARTIDAKTELQELTLGRGMGLPEYRLVEEKGPDHDRRFVVEVEVEGEIKGRGQGGAKKRAEQAAAANALRAFKDED
jgi:ribonuclease-3